jgi:hypothetical protein
VINKIADQKTESFLRRTLTAHQIEPIGVIYDDPAIGEAWLTGSIIRHSKTQPDVDAIVQELEKVAAEPVSSNSTEITSQEFA